MYELKIEESFAAAHRLRGYKGQCEDLHGHNWKVEVVVRADRLDDIGLALDFHELKSVTRAILERMDHKFLNDLAPFVEQNPSSENISRHIFEEVASQVEREGLWVHRVTAWESEKACASYIRD
ncbi:MAG: 6-carboxytetrahydropterin synthase QueD [Deltaproteobacteria bacterium]|nr:6-carboxytetrahydropterin synthase QueD [Deltaproteobacteria bacterium]